jgi:flagellar biosynthesis protein FlhG
VPPEVGNTPPRILPFKEEAVLGPAYRRRAEGQRIVALGGGKGGAGRTVLTANLGIYLAQLGKKVMLVDAALGQGNLHTCFALDVPAANLGDVLDGRARSIEEVAQQTGVPGLMLVAGPTELGRANPKHPQKLRVLEKIRLLEVDYVLLDLAAGTAYNTLDFYLAADTGLVVVMPEPTSIECAYRFLQSAFLRDLYGPGVHERESPSTRRILELLSQRGGGAVTPLELIAEVEAQDAASADFLRRRLRRFRPGFVINQARTTADGRLVDALRSVVRRRFGFEIDVLGPIDFDDSVWVSVRRRRPLVLEYPDSAAAKTIGNVARKLLAAHAQAAKRESIAPGA